MLIASGTISSTAWQASTPLVLLPVSDFTYAQPKDRLGNVTGGYSDTANPSRSPTAHLLCRVSLPPAMRDYHITPIGGSRKSAGASRGQVRTSRYVSRPESRSSIPVCATLGPPATRRRWLVASVR